MNEHIEPLAQIYHDFLALPEINYIIATIVRNDNYNQRVKWEELLLHHNSQ